MNNSSRKLNSIFNIISGFANKILSILLSFVVRTVFIWCLSSEYLGVNGLYTSILTMLSLAELGFGTAMVFSMYKPLAENDHEKLCQLLKLYKIVYRIIGTFILVVGLLLIPFLDFLIKDAPDIEGLVFYYILFLLNTVVSYWFFAYKNSLLQADQRAFIVTNANTGFNILKAILQIIILLLFHNFTLYLIIQIFCTIGQNIWLSIKVNKIYPWINNKNISKLPNQETKKIFKDVKALMLSKVSHVILNGTDNIIISSFVSFKWIGILSNFTLIVDSVTSILTQITTAITASLGNYFANNDKESGYSIFLKVEFLNFWLYGFSTISLMILLNPFISLWIGEQYTLDTFSVIALSINFFVAGFMNTLWTFRSTLGIFVQGQYRSLIVAVLNVVLSIGLSYIWGVAGVLIATSISRALVNLWYDPLLLHHVGFNKPIKPFIIKYCLRVCLFVILVIIYMYLSNRFIFVDGVNVVNFIIMCILIVVGVNGAFFVVFRNTSEFCYFYNIFNDIVKKLKKKIIKGNK